MKILGTGLSGLVGSRVVELLADSHSFTNLSLDSGVDITNFDMVKSIVSGHEAPWVLHLAAYTDVQGAEKERSLKEKSIAWKVNVTATQNLVDLCREYKKRLLYVDTDYAFAGAQKTYTEEDAPDPQGWYAMTKTEGAKRVATLGNNGVVIRISNPYRATPKNINTQVWKKDFVHKMLERLQQNLDLSAPSDQLFVPTFIDDIAQAIGLLMEKNSHGMYHVVGSTALSPYEAAKIVAKVFGCDQGKITATTFSQYFQGRAPIPQHAVLSNDKIEGLGVQMHSFNDGLEEVKSQEALA